MIGLYSEKHAKENYLHWIRHKLIPESGFEMLAIKVLSIEV